jgi:polycomb protein EED
MSNLGRPIPSGFQLCGALKESHGHPIYAVAWSPHVHSLEGCSQDDSEAEGQIVSYVATCGGPYAAIYEVASGNSKKSQLRAPTVRQVYRDVDEDETFYTCAFGGRGTGTPVGFEPMGVVVNSSETSEKSDSKVIYFGNNQNTSNEKDTETISSKRKKPSTEENPFLFPFSSTQNGPPLLCLAGTRCIIKVIDTVRRSLFLTLSGHGDHITDMQFSPTNEWLLLSASEDETIRLWDLQHGTNVAVYMGHDGHRRQVLSVSWHFSGTKFASSGMDNTIKLWDVIDGDPSGSKGTMQLATEKSGNGVLKKFPKAKFTPTVQQTPYFSTNKVHTDYVDCVQFIGDLILSKSVHNKIVLWKPLLDKSDSSSGVTASDGNNAEHTSTGRIPSTILYLREFSLTDCNSWFVRFHSPPPYHRILALGNQKGEVKIWQIGGDNGCHPDEKHYCDMNTSGIGGLGNGNSTVRMVKFSPDGSYLVAVRDDSTVWMWEADFT